jgi:ribosomal protein S18 acetylase RimI-like enzyme
MSESWRQRSGPRLHGTVGDLEWWLASAGPDADLAARVRLWLDAEDRPVAWAWANPPATLDWFVQPGLPAATEDAIRGDAVRWFEATIGRPDASPEVWGADGEPEATYLIDRGFAPTTTELGQFHRGLVGQLPEPVLPAGYALRTLAGTDEIPARVEVHRAAFAPSKMTVPKYELLTRLDHYAFDRDVVVTAPDGSFAAFTMCWWDPVGRIAEFEPVGTHPNHRRRGLARAANAFGLRLLRELGAPDVIVFSDRSNVASQGLYGSVGFREIAVHRTFRRPIAGDR